MSPSHQFSNPTLIGSDRRWLTSDDSLYGPRTHWHAQGQGEIESESESESEGKSKSKSPTSQFLIQALFRFVFRRYVKC